MDAARSPDYWFPRHCPRAMAWVVASTTDEDRSGSSVPAAAIAYTPSNTAGWT
ncbi:MAG TPA: hypothetical protein VFX16_00230 [Pseudonocardiaceae bacterium]|nr:hypothetical protein [Pseudonocardiaceae bacterium]